MSEVMTTTVLELLQERPSGAVPQFPMRTVPYLVSEMIEKVSTADGLPVEALAGAALFAFSTAGGQAYRARVTNTRHSPGALWINTVMHSSSGKSPAEKVMTVPLKDHNAARMEKVRDIEKFNAEASRNDQEQQPVPAEGMILFRDITMEAITVKMMDRPGGIGVLKGEFSDLLENASRGHGGNDIPRYLEAWNCDEVSSARVKDRTRYLRQGFLSLFTGVQPAIIRGLPKDHTRRNGFLPRFLWIAPDHANVVRRARHGERQDVPEFLLMQYGQAITRLIELGDDVAMEGHPFQPRLLDYTPDAWRLLDDFHHALMDDADAVIGTPQQELLGKLDEYVFRLSVVTTMMWWACSAEHGERIPPPEAIGKDDVERAIALVEFFRAHGEKVLDTIYSPDPTDGMTEQQRTLWNDLPSGREIARAELNAIALNCGMTGGTLDRFITKLKKDRALVHVKQGVYLKRA